MNHEYLLNRAARLIETHPYPAADPEALATLLERCQPLRLMDGAELCKEGEPGNALFFLLDGGIQVWRRDNRGEVRVLASIEAPDLVGHMALVDGSTRSASCSAVGHVRALVLERAAYQAIMSELSPEGTALRRILLSSLSQQLTGANRQLRTLVGGGEHEDDLPELEVEPLDTETAEVEVVPVPQAAVQTLPPATNSPDFSALEHDLQGENPIPSASDMLSEDDLLEVTGILEGWKRRR